jgi:hypothetical protein
MRKGPGSVYGKWNISVIICDTDRAVLKAFRPPRKALGPLPTQPLIAIKM